MPHELVVAADASDAAIRGAQIVAALVTSARGPELNVAVSGGRTPWLMFAELARLAPDLGAVNVYQCDERVAPAGSPDRNLTHLQDALGRTGARLVGMPVDDADLDSAAARYAAWLPPRFDLVHLGLGADGHTASLVPGDPVLECSDRLVSVTAAYQGHRRMTLTFAGLGLADRLLWVVTGAEKATALRALLDGDPAIPAARVRVPPGGSTILADSSAASTPLV